MLFISSNPSYFLKASEDSRYFLQIWHIDEGCRIAYGDTIEELSKSIDNWSETWKHDFDLTV